MLDQRRARRDIVARFEMDRANVAGDLRRDVDALKGAHAADGVHVRRPFLDARGLDGNGGGLGRERRGEEALHHVGLDDELEVGEPAGEADKRQQRDQENGGAADHQRQQPQHQQKRESPATAKAAGAGTGK